MIQIANVPYYKIYKFPYFSDAMALKIVLYALSILLPFFMVFSVNNFYLSFTDNITTNPTIKFNYQYHLILKPNGYVITTFQSSCQPNAQIPPMSFSYQNNQNKKLHTFTINVPGSFTQAQLAFFFTYSTNTIKNGQGMVYIQVSNSTGLKNVNVIGTLQIAPGQNLSANPPTDSQIFINNKCSPSATLSQLQQKHRVYLKSTIQSLQTSNTADNIFSLTVDLKSPTTIFEIQSASILGQVIWSFTQYFPIACIFILISQSLLSFLFRQNVIKRTVIHDKIQ